MRRKLLHLGLTGAGLFFAFIGDAQPVITSQPTNQSGFYGGNVTFSVMVTGVGPFTYQWLFNGTNLPSTNVITTVAGNGLTGFSGDGGLATNATSQNPQGIAVDQMGNILIADATTRIRKVDTNGIITTVAGNGIGSFSGDGGAATNASLYGGSGVVAHGSGNFFFSDSANERVRKVDTNGIITTVAGTNASGFFGDGGSATNAKLSSPGGIALDGFGNLFIADTFNNRIRKVNTNGIITTVAGTNISGFTYAGDGGPANMAVLQHPMDVKVDGFGNLFIADKSNNRIRKVDTNGIITTVAGGGIGGIGGGDGGAATNASLNFPSGVAVDAFGNLFFADTSDNRIRKVDTNGIITTVAGKIGFNTFTGDGGAATNAGLSGPTEIALDAFGNLLIADSGDNRIRKVNFSGSSILQLNSLTTNNAGNYQVIITSPSGSVTSSIAMFFPPGITTQPINANAVFGSSASLNVSIFGIAPFSYQWFASSGRVATAVPGISVGRVLSAIIIDGGAGYSSVPNVQFVGGSGSGAAATAVVNNGAVTGINMANQGSGYFNPPTIQIDPPSTINTPLSGQTNATLTLPAVTSNDSTNYFVVVTNNYGSVTSATVVLTVFLPPQNFAAQNLGTGLQLQLTGTPNYPYILQSATNLTPPIVWKSIYTNSADTNGNWQFTTSLNGGQKFYRAVGQ